MNSNLTARPPNNRRSKKSKRAGKQGSGGVTHDNRKKALSRIWRCSRDHAGFVHHQYFYSARSTVASTLSDVKAIETVRFQMMENRLYLGNYLLSGDLRDEDKTNRGINDLSLVLRDAESKVSDAGLKAAFVQVEAGEHSWADDFAKPMIAKRHQVDAGDATVSDLQIFYLQHDPNSWFNKSSEVLDEANLSVRKSLDDSNSSAASATSLSTIITT